MTFFRKIDEEKPRESKKSLLLQEMKSRVQRLKALLAEAKREQQQADSRRCGQSDLVESHRSGSGDLHRSRSRDLHRNHHHHNSH